MTKGFLVCPFRGTCSNILLQRLGNAFESATSPFHWSSVIEPYFCDYSPFQLNWLIASTFHYDFCFKTTIAIPENCCNTTLVNIFPNKNVYRCIKLDSGYETNGN